MTSTEDGSSTGTGTNVSRKFEGVGMALAA